MEQAAWGISLQSAKQQLLQTHPCLCQGCPDETQFFLSLFYEGQLLRAAPKDHQPWTANHHQPPTAPTANRLTMLQRTFSVNVRF